jgi:DNA-binding beta-propeller fold protein YncE
MKKIALLVFSAVLVAIASCTKENTPEEVPFAGIDVEVGEQNGSFNKLYILNEGAFPGASTLDLLDFKNKKYCADIFAQANPDVVQGLGNTANDMAVVDGKLWVALNASNQVAVLQLPSAKLERVIDVESPRYIAVDGQYVYVTSYASAVYGGENMVPGKVYRINKKSYETATVEVGYQPEGLAVLKGKLYVANSGGYNWVHDNRISVIDLASFKLEKHIEAPMTNLFQMVATEDQIWVSSYGESTWTQDEASGEWIQSVSAPQGLVSMTPNGQFTEWDGVHADKMCLCGNTLFCFGNAKEMEGGYEEWLYLINTNLGGNTYQGVRFLGSGLECVGYPYGILVNPDNGDFYICDASFTSGSKVHCFSSSLQHKWTVDTGVGTGHLLLQ